MRVLKVCLLYIFWTALTAWAYSSSTTKAPQEPRMQLAMAKVDVPDVYPVSTRAMLVEKSKEVDANLARGQKTGSYSASGWSNRLGTVLTPAAVPGVWTADRPFFWNKIDVGCRMTVIQLEGGDLWVHSPVFLDGALRDALSRLGAVKYVVSPNYEHLKFAPMWAEAYPEAFMWGCPGLREKLPAVKWTGEIPAHTFGADGSRLDNCWDFEEIMPIHVDMESVPVLNKPFFNEVIFYHPASKTLLTTDLYWNYPQSTGVPNSHLGEEEWDLAPAVDMIPLGSQLWKFGMDKVYYPFYMNLMINDRKRFDKMVDTILNEWDIETIIPAHGDLVHGRALARSVLERHFRIR